MRPDGAALTLGEFTESSGLDADFVRRMWVALGLPESTPVPLPVTPDVAEALTVLSVMAAGMGEDAVIGFARVAGSAAARLADALSGAMRMGVEIPELETGRPYVEVARQYSTAARDLLPLLWDAIGAVFRRHLVLVSYAQWTPDPDRVAVTQERTVGFADLVGSTEVLTRYSVAELARLVEAFEQLVWDVVGATGGRVVKLIGDEAMFVHDQPTHACTAATRLAEVAPHPIRVGLAHGNVVALRGDYYGPTVNLAARLVRVAPPATVVVSDAVRSRATSCAFQPFETGPMRGFPEDTPAYRLEP
jgi:class 3 adenylate cyclase